MQGASINSEACWGGLMTDFSVKIDTPSLSTVRTLWPQFVVILGKRSNKI